MPQYWGGPFRIRTFLRSNLPWFIINTGLFDKGDDCEKHRGHHEWYNQDNINSACYHCSVTREGILWEK